VKRRISSDDFIYTMSRPKTRVQRILDKKRTNTEQHRKAIEFINWRKNQRLNTEHDVKIMVEHKRGDTILCFDDKALLCNCPEKWKFMLGWTLEKTEKHLHEKGFTFHRM
jgi:hypothetical protein